MKTILEWIKANSKEGANIAEVEELISKSTFESITTKEQAIDFINKTPVFKSGLDSIVSGVTKSHDEKFKTDTLPGLLKAEGEKVRLELSPKETPQDKQIRELLDKDAARDKKDAVELKKSELRTKASELKYDPIRAERFAGFGDKALEMLEDDSKYWNGQIDTKIKESVKGTLSGNPPKGGTPPDGKMSLEKIAELPTRQERSKAMADNGYE